MMIHYFQIILKLVFRRLAKLETLKEYEDYHHHDNRTEGGEM